MRNNARCAPFACSFSSRPTIPPPPSFTTAWRAPLPFPQREPEAGGGGGDLPPPFGRSVRRSASRHGRKAAERGYYYYSRRRGRRERPPPPLSTTREFCPGAAAVPCCLLHPRGQSSPGPHHRLPSPLSLAPTSPSEAAAGHVEGGRE